MNNQREAAWRIDEEIANAGVLSRGNKNPPLKEVANDDQPQATPLALSDGEIRAALLQITTQAH